jgi:hypothetical protein
VTLCNTLRRPTTSLLLHWPLPDDFRAMSATTNHLRTSNSQTPGSNACPDPSAHGKAHGQRRLQDDAAGAALHATRGKTKSSSYPLGPDSKLSSAGTSSLHAPKSNSHCLLGAASSLKYARAQDLPSFPSVGIDTASSGLTAATLANSNKTTVEWWTPELSANASKAALLANGYKMAPLWQPEANEFSSKAAVLAAQGKGRDWWQPTASRESNSAASIAMRNKELSPRLDYGYTENGYRNSLLAARLSVKGRKRSESQPSPSDLYPDARNARSNALNAATMASSSNSGSRADAARVQNTQNVPRSMYTEHPPVDIEVADRRHQDALRASAMSMAKQMYAIQRVDDDGNVTIEQGRVAAGIALNTHPTSSDQSLKTQAMQYLTLQDAAQKLAAERLAKIGNQHESAAFQDYYGYSAQKRKSALSRLSIKGRRRASSEGEEMDSDDERHARRVRSQMDKFNNQLAEVDAKKRGQDRQALMAAAEKKVQAQMSKLDEKIYNETGKMSPAMVEEWDNKARARAMASSEARMQNHGKVHIGGGKYLDQSEIDDIAAARIQPTLDEINETAEKQRARDEEIRLDHEEHKRSSHLEKQRQTELKSEQKRIKSKFEATIARGHCVPLPISCYEIRG